MNTHNPLTHLYTAVLKVSKGVCRNFLVIVLFGLSTFPNSLQAQTLDTAKFMDLVYRAYQLQNENPDSAFKLSLRVLEEAGKYAYDQGKSYAYMRMGSIYNRRGANDSALKYMQLSYSLRRTTGDLGGAAAACVEMSYIYKDLGQLDSAFQWTLNGLQLSESIGDSLSMVNAKLELGNLMVAYNNDDPSTMFEEAINIAQEINYPYGVAAAYSGLGYFEYEQANFNKAEDFFRKSLLLFKSTSNQIGIAKSLANLSLCKVEFKEYQSAKAYSIAAAKIYDSLGLRAASSSNLSNLANLCLRLDQLDSAIYYSDKALKIAHEVGDLKDIIKFQEIKQLALFNKGELGEAYKLSEWNKYYRDSLLNIERVKSIEELQTKYETAKKEQEIALLAEQNKTQEARQRQLYLLSFILVILVLVVFFFYLQSKRIANKNERIAKQEMEAILDAQEIKTYNALLEGQEEERLRIATDLHDRLGSMLSTVKLLFSSLQAYIQLKENGKKQYEQAIDLVDEACIEVRRVSHNLGSGMVANFGLFKALQELCDKIDASGKISCQIQIFEIDESEIKLAIEVAIYRIAQETLNNAIKHANAKNIQLQLSRQENKLVLMIEDDGVGFEPKKLEKSEGLGIKSMKDRAQKLSGNVHLDAQIGRGLTTIVEIPLIEAA